MIRRTLYNNLYNWFLNNPSEPLIICGTRQTGKTSLVRDFSKSCNQFIELDLKSLGDRMFFENNVTDHSFFDSLFVFKGKNPDLKTLLFLDNLSESLTAIRWIKKLSPLQNIALISASANELPGLNSIRLFPFSFYEFLCAMGEEKIAESFLEVPYPIHDFGKLIRLYHLYTLIGGMPEIVEMYSNTREIADLPPIYEKILDLFMDEIENSIVSAKIRRRAAQTLENAFPFAASRVTFNHFASSLSHSREISKIFRLLEDMMLLKIVYPQTDTNVKVSMTRKKHSPKIQLPDTGLVNYYSGIQPQIFETDDLIDVFNGQIAKHVTGQEILSSEGDLSFWTRSKPQSTAEVDYLIKYKEMMIPVVVRSGETGRLRSLFQYIDSCDHNYAVRLWGKPLMIKQAETIKGKKFFLLNLPYFLAGKIKEYLPGFLKLSTA